MRMTRGKFEYLTYSGRLILVHLKNDSNGFYFVKDNFAKNYSTRILEYMRLAPSLFSQEPVAWPAFQFTTPARRLTRRNDKAHATI